MSFRANLNVSLRLGVEATPRQMELQRMRNRTPQQEGELRGLYAHPGDPKAIELVQREYLADQGLANITSSEIECLRVIRAQAYRRNELLDRAAEAEYHPVGQGYPDAHTYTVTLPGQNATSNPVSILQENMLRIQLLKAQIAGRQSGEPREIISRFVDEMPDTISISGIDDLGHAEGSFSPLAQYLMGLLPPTAFNMTGTGQKGSLPVFESVLCLNDQIRTKRFMLAIREAIGRFEESGMDTINMCDAGCGALPIFSIYAALLSEKVSCDSLELNADSAAMAIELVKALGLQDRVRVIQTDAITYKPQGQYDLLVSETMHSGLTQEPIVDIMGNLAKFVRPGGSILPSRITIKAAIVETGSLVSGRFIQWWKGIHPFIEPEWNDVLVYNPGDDLRQISFDLDMQGLKPGSYLAAITNEVSLGSYHLGVFESIITNPQYVRDINGKELDIEVLSPTSRKLHVSYKPGSLLNGVGVLR